MYPSLLQSRYEADDVTIKVSVFGGQRCKRLRCWREFGYQHLREARNLGYLWEKDMCVVGFISIVCYKVAGTMMADP